LDKKTVKEIVLYNRTITGTTTFPAIQSKTFQTEKGTYYLKEPGVILISRPSVGLYEVRGFLEGFDPSLDFTQYMDDPTKLTDGSQLCKIAGQVCYASFSKKRTYNKDAKRYFDNIKESSHGSVLQHANYSFLLYGISRSLTHELARHGTGTGISQLSQRYVNGKVLRFVERPEYQDDLVLHTAFEKRIDDYYTNYEELSEHLLGLQKDSSSKLLSAEAKTDLRKKVQQCSRSLLPNETEAPLIMTGNVRAWRHIIESRANEHAELEIRELALRIFKCLSQTDEFLFDDYKVVDLPDGTQAVHTQYKKV
jgi:thymidylate synthase (FAD)